MIPKDVAERKKATAAAAASQSTINDHAVPLEPKAKVIPYSHELFQQAALEWLIETDQVLLYVLFIVSSLLIESFCSLFRP
jgi:hypothetical protein